MEEELREESIAGSEEAIGEKGTKGKLRLQGERDGETCGQQELRKSREEILEVQEIPERTK